MNHEIIELCDVEMETRLEHAKFEYAEAMKVRLAAENELNRLTKITAQKFKQLVTLRASIVNPFNEAS